MQPWQRFLAVFQIAGGLCCVAGAFVIVERSAESLRFSFIVFPAMAGSISILAAVFLMMGHRAGLHLSLLVQAAQVVSLDLAWRFVFYTGPFLTWIVNSRGTRVILGAGGAGIFSTNPPPDATLQAIGLSGQLSFGLGQHQADAIWAFGFNFVALYFVLRLWKTLRAPTRVDSIIRDANSD